MDVGFLRCEKPRAEPRTGRPEREYGGNSTPVCDSASSDNWCVRNCINYTWHQWQCCNRTLHVTTCFPPLCNEDIDTRINGGFRLCSTPYRLKNSTVV